MRLQGRAIGLFGSIAHRPLSSNLDDEDAARVSLRFAADRQICHFHGLQSSSGVLSHITGYTRTAGAHGPFSMVDLQKNGIALGGTMELTTRACRRLRLRLAGIKRNG